MKTLCSIMKKHFMLIAFLAGCSFAGQGQVDFRQFDVTTSFTGGMDVYVEDIDGDGHKDIAAVGEINGGEVAWWKNDGHQQFGEKRVIRQNFSGARSVRAVDLDQDGDIDIISAAWLANQILWWENDGNQNWTEREVDPEFTGAHTVEVRDMNADGYLDVLCSGFDYYGKEGEIAWWKNDGNQGFTKKLISDRFQQSPFIYGEDMDGDGDLDVIACGELNGELYWWENMGNENFDEHEIDPEFNGAHTVLARDIDQDDDMDILGAACMGSRMVWWENHGYNDFEKHDLGSFGGALWLDAADVDLDGDIDLVGGGMSLPRVAVWYNDGAQDFSRYFMEGVFTSLFCTIPTDLDNDGDPDVVGIGKNSNMIAWEMNQTLNPYLIDAPESVAFDADHDRYLVSCRNSDAIIAMDRFTYEQEIFIDGLDGPLGNCIHDGVIYVATGETLRGFSLESKAEVLTLNIPCIQHLDGMTTDDNGYLYVIDTGGKIYKVELSTGGYETIVNSGLAPSVQDCIFDPANERLLAVAWSPQAPIQAIDLQTYDVTTATTTPYGYFDGITIDPEGNVYVASHIIPGMIIRFDADFSSYEIISEGHNEPAGLDYNSIDNILAVPNFGGDVVNFIQIETTGSAPFPDDNDNPLNIYPNPNNGKFMLQIEVPLGNNIGLSLTNSSGQVILTEEMPKDYNDVIFDFDLSTQPRGVYFLDLKNQFKRYSQKIIIK